MGAKNAINSWDFPLMYIVYSCNSSYLSGRPPKIAPLYCKAVFTALDSENSTKANLQMEKQTAIQF